MIKALLFFASLMCLLSTTAHSFELNKDGRKNRSFSKAKRLIRTVYLEKTNTFYCNCNFIGNSVKTNNCNYRPRRRTKRAYTLEWEHVVPAHVLGKSFPEWQNGHPKCYKKSAGEKKYIKGRRCASKVSQQFRQMEGDLYNLVPAVGQINAARSNFEMAMIPGEQRIFGKCDFEIQNHKIEPRPNIRGDIARIYFYMDSEYPNRKIISLKDKSLFRKWSRQDPIDNWERKRARIIESIQGNRNTFVIKN